MLWSTPALHLQQGGLISELRRQQNKVFNIFRCVQPLPPFALTLTRPCFWVRGPERWLPHHACRSILANGKAATEAVLRLFENL